MIKDYQLLSNFSSIIQENSLDISAAGGESNAFANAKGMLESAALYDDFTNKLFQDVFESDMSIGEQNVIKNILERQRNSIITDIQENSLASSTEAMSFAVASFPMLVDLYADPILSKVVTVYPYDKPLLTIPRIKWIATIIDEKGKSTDYEYPTATKAIRANIKKIRVTQNDNLFEKLEVPAEDFRISKRNARITTAKVLVDNAEKEVEIFGTFDAKGHFILDDVEIEGKVFNIQGNLVFNTGKIVWNTTDVTPSSVTSTTEVKFVNLEIQFRLHGNGIKKGVVTTKPLMSTVEIACDIEESFEIREIEEVLQDWKALWNLDILSMLKDHVKDQMKLNKDAEIADLLFGNIPAAKKYKLFREFDVKKFQASGEVKPTTVMDLFKNILPIVIDLVDQMRKRLKMEPKYFVCGTKAGSVLKSLQQLEMSMIGNSGEFGQVKGTPQINKFEVIVSDSLEEDFIHLVVKNEEYRLATILEVTYKPLYVIIETTDSKRRTFIKSRGWIGIVRNEGIATIQIKNFEDYLGRD